MDNFFDKVEAFRASLLARPEDCDLVVGHATFFRHFSGGRMFANCELAVARRHPSGSKTVEPVVRRSPIARCASAPSFRG